MDRQGVCEACNQPIRLVKMLHYTHTHTHTHTYIHRGPFASAMGRVWHPEHFVCAGCNSTLQNTTFVYEEEKIFCESCYQKTFAQTCHGCNKPIVGVSRLTHTLAHIHTLSYTHTHSHASVPLVFIGTRNTSDVHDATLTSQKVRG